MRFSISISVNIYLVVEMESLKHIRYIPRINNNDPCKISPNMTPNKNGKVIHVKRPGLNSIYLGMP